MSPPLVIISLAALSLAGFGCIESTANSQDEAVFAALKLSTEYNKATRPPPDNGTANIVYVYVYLASLVKVVSLSLHLMTYIQGLWVIHLRSAYDPQRTTHPTIQLHSATSTIIQQWTDSRLSWLGKHNSSLDSIDSINLPESLVWWPDFVANGVLDVKYFSSENSVVILASSGTVKQGTDMIITLKCQMVFFHFPFDKQTCRARMSAKMQIMQNMQLVVRPFAEGETVARYMQANNEYCVLSADLQQDYMYFNSAAMLSVSFQRRSTFYIVNLMLPSVLLLAISVIVFRLPPDCGERVSFSVTIVLSMCVFLQLAGNYTPTQSESVPLISWYFGFTMLLTMANVLCNVFVLACHDNRNRSSRVNNKLIRALFLNRLLQWRGQQRQERVAHCSEPQIRCPDNDREASWASNEWAKVVLAADRVFFYFFLLTTLCLLGGLAAFHYVTSRAVCIGEMPL